MADRTLGSRAGKSQTVRVEVPAHCEPLAAKMRSHSTTRSPSLGVHFLVVPSRLPQDRGGGIGYHPHLGKGKLKGTSRPSGSVIASGFLGSAPVLGA